jgi:hypothetical protein
MNRFIVLAATACAVVSVTAVIANAEGGKLRCFADSPATCTPNSAAGATLDTTGGGDAGVYLTNGKSTGGATLADADFSFTYFCANTTDLTSCIGGGAPRWSIPINTGGDAKDTQQVYAFLDAQGCLNGGTAPSGGTLTVSTTLTTCPVTLNTGGSWANWDAFAAANPSYTIANALPFVIADVTTGGQIIISNVDSSKS